MYYLLKGIDIIINILPHPIALGIGVGIGRLFYILDKKHRKLAIANINKVFGDKKHPDEIVIIAKRSFENLGKNTIEFFRKIPKDFELEGYTNIESFIKNSSSMIFVLGHFGNWELLGRIAADHGLKITAVGRLIKNKGVDRFIREKRTGSGLDILGKRGSAKELLKVLSEDKSIAILIDQYAGRRGEFVDFFGIPTSTTPSPAILALRTDIPVIPAFIVRDGRNKHKIVIEPSIEITKTGNITEDVHSNTQKIIQPLEDYVNKYPEQWWWVHRRWREPSNPIL